VTRPPGLTPVPYAATVPMNPITGSSRRSAAGLPALDAEPAMLETKCTQVQDELNIPISFNRIWTAAAAANSWRLATGG
jgi:hypothetical protein